jgi:O-antigen/teichoic acid export membrane protein
MILEFIMKKITDKHYTATHKVVFNTGILYVKMLIVIGVQFYSTRLVLNALGASDFGIFNLIAGVIAMLTFLNAAMTTSTQRYFSYYQGLGDLSMQKKIFSNSWILHILIGLVVVSLLLSLTPFLFNGFLNIPAEKISTAKNIYYFMSISVFFTIISVPFTASINAHENMLLIAIVSILDAVFKLAISLSIIYFAQSERLYMYGIFMASLTVIVFSLYGYFCIKKYKECNILNYKVDKDLMLELGSFSGWNLVGALSGLGRTQGFAVLLNMFLGTIANSAYGIASQISGGVNFFAATMLKAINPQIMKSEGANNRLRMLRLSMIASKFGFFLLSCLAIPCLFELPAILKFWLKEVPENTLLFCSFMLISAMIDQLTNGLTSAIQATGKIRNYMIVVGLFKLMILPCAYILLKSEFLLFWVLFSYVSLEVFGGIARIIMLNRIAEMSVKEYFNRVFNKEILPTVLSVSTTLLIIYWLNFNFRFLVTIPISIIVYIVSIYYLGLCSDEKIILNKLFKTVSNRIKINGK